MRGNAIALAPDTVLNRHLAQLAVTRHLLVAEHQTQFKTMNITEVRGLLIYANDSGVDAYNLSQWWIDRAAAILRDIS